MVNVEHCVKGNVTKLTQRPDRDGGGQINSGKACGIVSVSPFSCASTLLSCTTQNRFLEKKTKRVRTSPTFEIGLNKLLGHRFHPGLKKKNKEIERHSRQTVVDVIALCAYQDYGRAIREEGFVTCMDSAPAALSRTCAAPFASSLDVFTSTLATIRDPRTSTRHNENGPVPSPFRGDTPEMRRHRFDCSSCPTGTQHNFVFEPAAKEVCRGQYHY